MKRTLLFSAALAFAAASFAQQYKWVDQNGKIQYGDTPPAGAKATPLRPPSGPSSSAAPEGKKDAKKLSPEQAFQKRQKEEQERSAKADKERKEAETRRVNCEQAQASLRTLQSGQRVSTTNAAGERIYMEDSQVAVQIERAQKTVSEWCK